MTVKKKWFDHLDPDRAFNVGLGVFCAIALAFLVYKMVTLPTPNTSPCNGCVYVTTEGEGNTVTVETMSSAEEGATSGTPKNVKASGGVGLKTAEQTLQTLRLELEEEKQKSLEELEYERSQSRGTSR